ncbi:unnamed protein product [Rhizophagus irregularis]|nr:unnamed protein product [Rhizophagus irregularis]CAB5299976.1 unnamed protein product [Rhizophagus irregularis]
MVVRSNDAGSQSLNSPVFVAERIYLVLLSIWKALIQKNNEIASEYQVDPELNIFSKMLNKRKRLRKR